MEARPTSSIAPSVGTPLQATAVACITIARPARSRSPVHDQRQLRSSAGGGLQTTARPRSPAARSAATPLASAAGSKLMARRRSPAARSAATPFQATAVGWASTSARRRSPTRSSPATLATARASDIGGNGTGNVTGSNNLIGTGGSGGLTDGTNGNIVLTSLANLGLAPLGNYGGPTQTMALLPGSAAIGKGTAVNGVTTDQRGEPLDSPPDIGAFQSQRFTLTVDGGTGADVPDRHRFRQSAGRPGHGQQRRRAGGRRRRDVHRQPSSSGAAAVLSGSPAMIGADGTASVTATANLHHRLLHRRGVNPGSRHGPLQPDEHEGDARGQCHRRRRHLQRFGIPGHGHRHRTPAAPRPPAWRE